MMYTSSRIRTSTQRFMVSCAFNTCMTGVLNPASYCLAVEDPAVAYSDAGTGTDSDTDIDTVTPDNTA